MSRKLTIEDAGTALLKTYVSSLVSCTDKEGKTYTYYRGDKQNMNPEAFLEVAANIATIALDVALKNGMTEQEFWEGMRTFASDADAEEIEPKNEKDEPHGIVVPFTKN